MIPEEDTIRELRRLLDEQKELAKAAQKKADDAELRAQLAETQAAEAEKKAAAAELKAKSFEEDAKKYRELQPLIEHARKNYTDLLTDVTAGILKHCNDIPDSVNDQLSQAFVKVHEEFARCPQYRLITRLLKS
ncbi:MAG: hypothetical protein ACI4SV_06790, partial [Duodenibacillus sp.]